MKKFDFVIGNPPYQDNTLGDNATFAPPIYDKFMDAAFEVADKVELITPGRFLFNAGSTPKSWNNKMLKDCSFKILQYEANSKNVFPNTDIMGGVAISYRDNSQDYGAIEVFVADQQLRNILMKVKDSQGFKGIDLEMFSGYSYHFTEKVHIDFPNLRFDDTDGQKKGKMSKGHDYDLKSNVLDNLPELFFDKKPNDQNQYLQIIGRKSNKRCMMYVRKDYIKTIENTNKYKVFIPCANGSKEVGSTGELLVVGKGIVSTETFMSLGTFNTEKEAINAKRYLSTKFARILFSVLKITQHITPATWKYVPLQNFTDKSDIDWSKSIAEIDQQLYKKYNLTEEEISFIETHVKEMN